MDKNRLKENIIIGSSILLIGIVIFFACLTIYNLYIENKVLNSISNENSEYLSQINEAMNLLEDKYIDIKNVDKNELVIGAIEGLVASVDDPYTRFVSNEEFLDMITPSNEEYFGIGVHVVYDREKNGILIVGVMPGSEAESKGMKLGDIILQVNDIKLSADTYTKAIDAIKGEENTKVKLTILKENGKIIEEQYTRRKTVVTDIEFKTIENNIGYIKINSFGAGVSKEFEKALNKLKNKAGLIIDLRNNPGGTLTEVVDIAESILPKGEIVRIKYTDKQDKVYYSDGSSKLNIPLIVLVNEDSASASEILAGAVKDLKGGTVVGTTTFGKGIVQSVEKLDSGIGAISITNSKYYTASGNEIHGKGIIPNIEIHLDEKVKDNIYLTFDEDIQLQKAIEIIKK